MNRVKLWVNILRPKTLAAGWSPVIIGLIVASELVGIDWIVAMVTIVAATAIQIISNLVNDYYDFKSGLDKAGRVGFKRALAEGSVSPKQMLRAIFITTSIAVLCGAYLIFVGGLPILLIGVFSLLFAWLYTATSKSLSYLGIADIFVFIFFGPVASVGTTYLQAGELSIKSLFLGVVCGLVSTSVLVVNNLRDLESDKQHGKRSLPVRFGKRFGQLEYLFAMLATIPSIYLAGGVELGFLIIIPALLLYRSLINAEGAAYNSLLAKTGMLNMLFALLIAVDILLL
ncbi:MAG: 1,4-dihydroxy-2-naphthoate octaprenyltransferase [Bacteroidales bacterium]